tara:strand:- start:752 stop:1501 length:750 start_codon:yes stop_codon:yes gene_type:complete
LKYQRTYTGEDGHTHFEEVDVPYTVERGQGRETDLLPAASIHFRVTPGTMNYSFHTAPRRRLIVMLSGALEVETGLGEKRQFRAGDVLEVGDTHGHGHISRALGGEDFRSAFINLDDELVSDRRTGLESCEAGMEVIRCRTGADGQSHFSDDRLPFVHESPSGRTTAELPLKGFQFVLKPPTFDRDFHNAPQRQVLLCLTGGINVEVGDGTQRTVEVGDIYFGEDDDGQGHISRALNGLERISIFAHLA